MLKVNFTATENYERVFSKEEEELVLKRAEEIKQRKTVRGLRMNNIDTEAAINFAVIELHESDEISLWKNAVETNFVIDEYEVEGID